MSWSKIKTKNSLPLGWWYHKILCEFWYWKEGSGNRYYSNLSKMIKKYNRNLYGEIYNQKQ